MHTGVTTKLTKVEGIPFSLRASRTTYPSWLNLAIILSSSSREKCPITTTPTEGMKPLDIPKKVKRVHACVCEHVCICLFEYVCVYTLS